MTGSTNCPITSPIELQSLALRVVGSEHHGRVLRIQAPKCTIGSAAGCTLRLKAPGVRDVHCLVLRGPGGLALRSWSPDTRLNGQTVVDAPLRVGDRLAVGTVELEVLDPASLDQWAESGPPGAIDDGRLSRIEQKARDTARARDELARRLAERDQFVSQLEERLATTQQLVEQLQAESQSHPAPAAAPDPATLAEIESLKQQAETLAQQFEVARHSFATERDTWQRERQNLQQQVEDAQNQNQLLTHGIEQARSEAIQKQAAWDHQHEHLTADLERARHQIATNVEQQREAREAEVAITHWRERAEELAQQVEALQQQIEELHNTRDDAASEHLKLRAELEAGARELDAETERLIEREETLAAQQQQFEAEYEQATAELDARQQQLETLRADFEARQAALHTDASAEASSEEMIRDQSAELVELQQQLANLQTNYEQQTHELELRRAELDERATALDRQAEELRLESERLAAAEFALQNQREEASPPSPCDNEPFEQTAADDAPFVPQSASDIIARLSASGLWKEDDAAEEPLEEPATPEPAWKTLVADEPKPAAAAAAQEEEDSIEAYMQRLLQRVSGESDAGSRSMPSKPSLPIVSRVEAETPTVATPVVIQPEVEPFDPAKYVPRSTAPEATSKLAAMRELANSSARSAIHTSSKRRHAKHLSGKLGLSLFALGAAISLGWLALQTHSTLSYYAAIGACGAGLLWSLHAGYLWLKKGRHAIERPTVNVAAEAEPLVETHASQKDADASQVDAAAVDVVEENTQAI